MTKRIVITTFDSYGDVNPYVGLALALRARGHEAVIATSPYYREYVEREGIAFRPVRPDVNPNDRALVARIMDPRKGTEFMMRGLLMPNLHDAFDDLSTAVEGADLLVTHPITYAGPIVAQERALPWVSTVLSPMSFFSPHDLPVFPPMPWTKGLERVPGAARLLVQLAKAVARRWTEPVQRLRAERGLPPGADPVFEGQHSPALVLALFSRVLGDPQPDWPANVRTTGAVFYNGPTQDELADDLEQFMRAGPPPIVFTLGSAAVSAAGTFYQESAAAAHRLGLRAVLLIGRHPENRPPGRLPEGIVVAEHAPHSALFPRAAAVVHQGGIGTLHQALRSGRPMLVVPHAHDQPDNAYRVARLGVGRVLYPNRYTANRVAAELRQLLEEPSYAARSSEIAATVRGEDGVAVACDALETQLAA